MKRRYLVLSALLLGLLVWFLWPRHEEGADPSSDAARVPPAAAAIPPPPSPPAALPEPRSTLADGLNAPAGDIRADLRIVSGLIDAFRSNFPREGNPVGNNADITAALAGRNRLRLAVLPPDHPAINPAGELCDRWGTPFFFHAESATRMEIRSAGPDRRLWTDDDLFFTP